MEHDPFSRFKTEKRAVPATSPTSLDSVWEQTTVTGQWQIVPPVITTGRLLAMKQGFTPEQAPAERNLTGLSPAEQDGQASGWRRGVRPGLPPADYASQWDKWTGPARFSPATTKKRIKRPLPTSIQQGYASLTESSVVTVAPLLVVAFWARDPWTAFLVGVMAALAVAFIRVFVEFIKHPRDTRPLLSRGMPGLLTFCFGIIQTLPFLLPTLQLALYTDIFSIALQMIALMVISAAFSTSS